MERALMFMSRVLGIIAALAIVVLMLATVTDVTVRWITKSSVPGMMELAESSLVISVFFGLAWTAMQGGHVSVSLLTDRLGERSGRIVAVLMWATSVALLGWFTYATYMRAVQSTQMNEIRFGLVQWPMYPLRWVITIGFFCWLIVAIVNLVRVIAGKPAYGDDVEEVSAA